MSAGPSPDDLLGARHRLHDVIGTQVQGALHLSDKFVGYDAGAPTTCRSAERDWKAVEAAATPLGLICKASKEHDPREYISGRRRACPVDNLRNRRGEVVPRNASALELHEPEKALCVGVPLIGREMLSGRAPVSLIRRAPQRRHTPGTLR